MTIRSLWSLGLAAVGVAVVSTAGLVAVEATPARAATTIQVPADQPSIAAALAVAVDGDTIEVSPGTYDEPLDYAGKDVAVRSAAGPATTTITGTTVLGPGGSLEGFTITTPPGTPHAVETTFTGAVIRGNVFRSNMGVYGYGGSAIGVNGDSVEIDRNTFTENSCEGDLQYVAGVITAYGSPTITNNLFIDNPCNVAINDQSGPTGAGTIVANTIVGSPVGLHLAGGPTLVRNNLVTGSATGVRFEQAGMPLVFDHNLVGGNQVNYTGPMPDPTGTNGNLGGDPKLIDYAGHDLRLQATSPAVDAGSADQAPLVDFDGSVRPLDGPDADTVAEFDIGAFERDGTEPPPVRQTGILDPGWSGDGRSTIPSQYPVAVGPYGSGRIYVGSFRASDGNGQMRISKYDAAGGPAAGWGSLGYVRRQFGSSGASFPTQVVPHVLTWPRVTVAGEFYTGSTARVGVTRLRSDGTYDPAFSGDGQVVYKVFASEHDVVSPFRVDVLSGGKIGLAIAALDADSGGVLQVTEQALIRLNATGSLDTSFSGDGKIFLGPLHSDARFLPNGAVFIGLQYPTLHQVRKYLPSGALDPSFSGDGLAWAGCGAHRGANLAVDSAGRPVLMCVRETSPSITLAMYRFTTAGVVDVTYSGDGKTNLVLQDAMAGSWFLHFDETAKPWAATLNDDPLSMRVYTLAANGSPDATWNGDGVATLAAPLEAGLAGLARSDNRLFVLTYRGSATIALTALKA